MLAVPNRPATPDRPKRKPQVWVLQSRNGMPWEVWGHKPTKELVRDASSGLRALWGPFRVVKFVEAK
jgi:hypothetical protein